MKRDFGTLKFKDDEEYYTGLGTFCNSKAFSISYEPNKLTGSYADAYRLRKLSTAKELIPPIKKAIRSGNRINCNKYVDHLIKKHNFVLNGKSVYGNLENVIKTVPEKYISYFINGYRKSSIEDNNTLIVYEAENIKNTATSLRKVNIPKSNRVNNKNAREKSKTKHDYIKKQIQNVDIGERGEKLVFKLEKEKLLAAVDKGIIESLEGYLEWVSLEDDSKGYDILSFNLESMKPMYIEVKTTTGTKMTPFYMSRSELEFSRKNSESYYLYRIYDLKKDVAEYFELVGDISESTEVEIDTVNYLVSIK